LNDLSFPCGICFEARFIPKKLISKFADETGRGYLVANVMNFVLITPKNPLLARKIFGNTRKMDILSEDSRAVIDYALQLEDPSGDEKSLGAYMGAIAAALHILKEWSTVANDQIETVHLLRKLKRVHEMYLFSVDDDDFKHTISAMRQSCDVLVRQEAAIIFPRLVSFEINIHDRQRPDIQAWTTASWKTAASFTTGSSKKPKNRLGCRTIGAVKKKWTR
tara:strand:- start:556 stop:1218 length:663 start_codon:yes stop_codon:yes gene_type:complete